MADGTKKISFGFAKSIKKPVLQNAPVQEKKVDYIECLDGKSIKVIGEEERIDEPLVIPMLGSKTWHDRIINKIDADVFEPKNIPKENEAIITVKEEPIDVPNGTAPSETPVETKVQIKEEPKDESKIPVTLDELAAKEIIQELKSEDTQSEKKETLTLPVTDNQNLRGHEESSLQDYEQIPVDAFGMAMLRGMGWQPGKGIGKNGKIVAAVTPELRPKGMGLGADKVTVKKPTVNSKGKQEELKLEKGSFVKIIAGKQNNNYGQVEGFDDDAGRLIVKLALGGGSVSLSEFMVQQVTKVEYAKNSKVLNASKYEKYKNKEANDVTIISSESSDNNDGVEKKSKHRKNEEKKKRSKEGSRSRKHKKHESDSDGDEVEKKSRKRRSSSSSESHKPKKSKKHKKHDSSPERSSRKHKKREKERETSRDRRKNKKHKRSRSKSPKKR